MNNKLLLKNSIFKLGHVFSVDGRDIRIKIDKKKNLSHLIYNGTLIKNVSVGSYVKISKGFLSIIVKVDGEYIKELFLAKSDLLKSEIAIDRILKVSLLGYIDNNEYYKGIKEMPLIGDSCYLLDNKEFNLIHKFAKNDDETISIGDLALNENQSIDLSVNSLFSSHIGVFGNTGSGKSYTLAKLYRELFKKYEKRSTFQANARFLLFDFNGEYSGDNVIVKNKQVYKLSTKSADDDKLPLNSSAILSPDIMNIMASASEKTQQPFIKRALKLYKKICPSSKEKTESLLHFKNSIKRKIVSTLTMSDIHSANLLLDYLITILPNTPEGDKEVSLKNDFNWHGKSCCFYTSGGYLNAQNNPEDFIRTLKIYQQVDQYQFPENIISKFIHFLYLQLIYDVSSNRAQNEHIFPAINKLKSFKKDFDKTFRITEDVRDVFNGHHFCVVDMNNLNTTMKKIVPMLLSYRLYIDQKSRKEKIQNKSLNIIIDEAHNILSYDSQRESEAWKDFRLETFEEIIKEGRKFGVFLTVASQRPSDISRTIISQLHNFIIHRLVNEKDLEMIANNISYLDKLSVESLPILSVGHCVLSGTMAQMPVIINVAPIEEKYKPHNETIKLVENWQ